MHAQTGKLRTVDAVTSITQHAPALIEPPGLITRVLSFVPKGIRLSDEAWQRRHRFIHSVLVLQIPILFAVGIARGYGPIHAVAGDLPGHLLRRCESHGPFTRLEGGLDVDRSPRLQRSAGALHRRTDRGPLLLLRADPADRALPGPHRVRLRHRVRCCPARADVDHRPQFRVQPSRRTGQPRALGGRSCRLRGRAGDLHARHVALHRGDPNGSRLGPGLPGRDGGDARSRPGPSRPNCKSKVDEMLVVLDRAASGDLTCTVTVTGDDAVGQMGIALASCSAISARSIRSSPATPRRSQRRPRGCRWSRRRWE